ncbi:MAG: hypothetical protein JXN61_13855 [Sedimentisphaerales bacterium]|nr:hypothetical protein [Sedimentisphaerales bacterium]
MDSPNFKNPAAANLDRPIPSKDDLDKPIPLENFDKPIPLENVAAPSRANVSHAPLNLGGPAPSAGVVRTASQPPTAAAQMQPPRMAVRKPVARVVSSDRISGVKTFFTKLHPGAIEFLDEQICNWLKENPGISIKRTNVVTGEIQAKKTEPNIIITVWY